LCQSRTNQIRFILGAHTANNYPAPAPAKAGAFTMGIIWNLTGVSNCKLLIISCFGFVCTLDLHTGNNLYMFVAIRQNLLTRIQMKLIKILCLTIGLIAVVTSCSKTTVSSVDLGNTYWSGSAVVNSQSFNRFEVALYDDGSADLYFNSISPYLGTWNKRPNKDSVFIYFEDNVGEKWRGEARLNSNATRMEGGMFIRLTNTPLTGTFTTAKQQ
jgi:hypothetical protein